MAIHGVGWAFVILRSEFHVDGRFMSTDRYRARTPLLFSAVDVLRPWPQQIGSDRYCEDEDGRCQDSEDRTSARRERIVVRAR